MATATNGRVSAADLKALILGLTDEDDRPVRRVPMPEWGFPVYIRACTGWQRDELEIWQTENKNVPGFRAKVVTVHLCGSDGEPVPFDEADVMQLSGRSSKALARLVDACLEESGFSKEDVEELEGNSEGGTSDESG